MIPLKTLVWRKTNKLLSYAGFELNRIGLDLDARLTSKIHLERMFAEIAEIGHQWLDRQKIFAVKETFSIEKEVSEFYQDYLKHAAFRNPKGGSRFGNLLWLDIIAKSMSPEIIIDSGTYTGASAWALARGASNAKVLSFDIDMSRIIYRSPGVEYIESDFTSYSFSSAHGKNILCYFDDHVDQGKRLKEAADRNVFVSIFDDDYTLFSFPSMALSGKALPKISFILDSELKDGEMVEWTSNGKGYKWIVNRNALNDLQKYISDEARLPNIGAPLGMDQLPYRIIGHKLPS